MNSNSLSGSKDSETIYGEIYILILITGIFGLKSSNEKE